MRNPFVLTRVHSSHENSQNTHPRTPINLVNINNFLGNSSKTSKKRAEIKIAACMASHASLSCINHTGEVIKEFGVGSSWEKLRLHCTKCTALVNTVISQSFKGELKKAIQGRKFSLMADESTDCSSSKIMIVSVKYYNSTLKKVIDEYLGVIDVLSCTGEALFVALKKVVEDVGLDLDDCIGFGSDGANNVAGKYIGNLLTQLSLTNLACKTSLNILTRLKLFLILKK